MVVRSAEDIIKKAHRMEIARMAGAQAEVQQNQLQALNQRLDVLEAQLQRLMQKFSIDTITVHTSLLNALADWKSTNQLAQEFNYSQEYVSRCVSQLRKGGQLEQKKNGKTIFYKKIASA